MDICAYHIARRASAYKWFFYVFFYNNNPYYPWSTKKIRGDQCHPWEKKKPPRAYTRSGYLCLILRVSESREEFTLSLPNRRTQQEQSYAGINYALQGGGRRSQPGAESAKPKQSFVSLSSGRQTKHGRSSCRLVREQRKLAIADNS